jgi:hypothetical protein
MCSLGMNAAQCKQFTEFLLNHFAIQWNLNSCLREITWDVDMKCDLKLAKKFMTEQIPKVYNLKLTKIKMAGVFENNE